MAEENKSFTEPQNAQAAAPIPPVESNSPAPQAAAAAPPAGDASATSPQGNEGTHGLADPTAAPADQAADNNQTTVDGQPIAAAPEDGFDPDAIAPAAGAAAGGGGGAGGSASFNAYDPGALGGGRGALGLLGALDLTTTPLSGLPGVGGGAPDDGVSGRPTDAFLSGAGFGYENATPNAHMGDPTQQATQLTLTFTPQNGATLTSVTITLPEGVGLSIDGAPPVYGTVTVPAAQIGNLVLITPPYSDADVTVSVTPTVTDRFGGLHTLEPISATVVIDAVAQRPENVGNALVDDGNAQHSMSDTTTTGASITDGLEKTDYTVTAGANEARVNVSLTVTARFQDFDGSEQHYMLVEQLPGFTGPYPTVVVDGVTYFQIPVDNAMLAANGGTATLTITLQAPQTTADTSFSVRTGAMAQETPTDGELRTDNNTAVVIDNNKVDFTIDVINSTLSVESGWASEGNDDAKHTGGGSDTYAYTGPEAAATATNADDSNNGAPVRISLSGGQDSAETIQSVTVDYDGDRGMLYYNGQPVPPGTVLDVSGSNLAGLNLVFVPSAASGQQYNSDDVKLSYTVNVQNGAGASATFTGSSSIVIDAVADQGTMGRGSVDYAAPSHTAAEAGEVVKVNGSVTFSDTDGSELHYAVIAIPDGLWSIAGLDHSQLLSKDALNAYWREKGGMPASGANAAVDAALNGILTSGNADPSNNQYLLIEVDPATGTVTVYARDASGAMTEVNIPGLQVSYVNGVLTYTVPVQTPSGITQDTSMDVSSQGVSLEKKPGDGEYDYANNIATTDTTEKVKVEVDVITGRLVVSLSMHEDGQAQQNQTDASGNKDTTTEAGWDSMGPGTGMPITMQLIDPDTGLAPTGSEYVKSITIGTLPTDGTLFYNGQPVAAGQTIDNPDLTKFSFSPTKTSAAM